MHWFVLWWLNGSSGNYSFSSHWFLVITDWTDSLNFFTVVLIFRCCSEKAFSLLVYRVFSDSLCEINCFIEAANSCVFPTDGVLLLRFTVSSRSFGTPAQSVNITYFPLDMASDKARDHPSDLDGCIYRSLYSRCEKISFLRKSPIKRMLWRDFRARFFNISR